MDRRIAALAEVDPSDKSLSAREQVPLLEGALQDGWFVGALRLPRQSPNDVLRIRPHPASRG
jgi:hypothetical protein